MAESAFRPWQDLPSDLLTTIARRLPCLVERLSMSRACHDWWFAVQCPLPPIQRQLPWLLLPDTTTSDVPRMCRTWKVSVYCVSGSGDTHNLRVRHEIGNARFFGAYDGGWIMLACGQTDRHMLVNLHTDRRLFLPDHFYYVPPVGDVLRTPPLSITILVATFSSPPGRNMQCLGAAIVNSTGGDRRPHVAFWSMEVACDQRPVAIGFTERLCGPWSRLEDVIHHKGAFHFLTDWEHVLVYDIFNLQEDEERIRFGPVGMHHHEYLMQGEPQTRSSRVRARYLVESRGELLMVVRYRGDSPIWSPHTGEFQVYQATQRLTGSGLVEHAWTELISLDGRMLFVGRGCSRSYEVADFLDFGFGEGIYFLDDKNVNNIDMVCLSVLKVYQRQYNCSDNGRCQWVEGEPRLQVFRRWFTNKKCSEYSTPIWFIP